MESPPSGMCNMMSCFPPPVHIFASEQKSSTCVLRVPTNYDQSHLLCRNYVQMALFYNIFEKPVLPVHETEITDWSDQTLWSVDPPIRYSPDRPFVNRLWQVFAPQLLDMALVCCPVQNSAVCIRHVKFKDVNFKFSGQIWVTSSKWRISTCWKKEGCNAKYCNYKI